MVDDYAARMSKLAPEQAAVKTDEGDEGLRRKPLRRMAVRSACRTSGRWGLRGESLEPLPKLAD